ncbi:MAG: hypothetical protein J7480_04020 [Microbacteriaceae bacterium]|nr:hypothetical protein [Microbacteriaceae bacterium]
MDSSTPQFLPTLSAGKHRTPAQGACFMEYASFLAGERWSDRPTCTDPILAELARCVNDSVSDQARQWLLEDVTRVIGLRGDEILSLHVALRTAVTALPHVAPERKRSLAIGIRGMLLALAVRGETSGVAVERAVRALAAEPEAAAESAIYHDKVGNRPMHLIEVGGTQAIRHAVEGLLRAADGRGDADERLAALLRAGIDEAEASLDAATAPVRAALDAARLPAPRPAKRDLIGV